MITLFRITRRFVVITVVSCLALFAIVTLYGVVTVGMFIVDLLQHGPALDSVSSVVAIVFKLLDLFLITTILYIVALGLSALFLDAETPLPKGLHVASVHDLKVVVSEAAILVMAVAFLGHVLEWERGADILYIGGGVALVIAALALVVREPRK